MTTARLTRPLVSLVFAAAALGALASCASGPTYAEMKSKLPPIAKGQGRVFVYRPGGFVAIKPAVKIDDQLAGTSQARGFFYSDQKAGTHNISIATEWNHKNTVTVAAGQSSFVECMVTPGAFVAHIIPNQVDTATGEANIQECKMAAE